MNIPNRITVSRICLIPIFVLVMVLDFGWGDITLLGATMPVEHLVGGIIFIVASLTDWIDGYYARKHDLVTNMGKFLDPLADKLLVSAAFILLIEISDKVPAWIIIVIISREFAVTGLRLICAEQGEVVAANQLGKIKTWAQIVAITLLLLHNVIFEMWNFPADVIMLWVALGFTVWSGIEYFWLNRRVLLESK
ncbi:CDP-diacylglycerol--glycerol-3-phosphate 3-phosphatidyltransferase [Kurthia zopfii]|uniref:CDP-diacylglycerol--glycerol-3-phosphate 3-phosphatidyltransferase n=1 Tax=Kurthia zopfii TaxID=1650 RepID=A0A8B4Q8S2_9BACL|nr:CDP-diacylglycerol--glycerol-3-phosphate 3-phosphatidyltransferase [Kurthia zopfii]PWI22793.1 CDP-diacylglycerol--glycerol-3-phosphate 3-phosphatidyltransferase [Kurthia zopfii]TDR41834.1 CDP-diacylglycerol--glycerol-3-phosphate 3-phosphatidyltransferase [Kurthia zopfii]GEK31303.1 CDP-diacylglycerol--glycerol-3-phosphate 3-phosphatidyltransferase [Kurthia zopfii]STX09145.1 CDP-diacylglycerol--glycerol-3-phosphate 3-phosphatidyltransferase [Kurthia zopfii]